MGDNTESLNLKNNAQFALLEDRVSRLSVDVKEIYEQMRSVALLAERISIMVGTIKELKSDIEGIDDIAREVSILKQVVNEIKEFKNKHEGFHKDFKKDEYDPLSKLVHEINVEKRTIKYIIPFGITIFNVILGIILKFGIK